MPYNKGDFTQQGVAGDVSALVRLNEKRVMKVVLSSDDESDNCDISGAVTDLLNNEVYPIGAGVSGNIEITENGENINVAPYATATVNVAGGGGGGPKCTLNIVASNVGETLATLSFEEGKYAFKFIPDNTTTTAYAVYFPNYPTEFYRVAIYSGFVRYDDLNNPTNVLDLVNLTVDENNMLIVTDPTQDSSCTISATEFFVR